MHYLSMVRCLRFRSPSFQTVSRTGMDDLEPGNAGMGDPEPGNDTDEVFRDPAGLQIFTLNDLFNVIAYTVMSLGEYCDIL